MIKAKVKNIKIGAIIDEHGHCDCFERNMFLMRGKVINVEPLSLETGKNPYWWTDEYGWNFHVSWLDFI